MKKIVLLIALCFQLVAISQTQDLVRLAKGDYQGFNAVFDEKENLFGYVALYGYGQSGPKTKKFEYVILDKNLNPVANNEFEGDITVGRYFAYMDFRGKIILRPVEYDASLIKMKEFFEPFSMEIDLKTNEIKKKVYPSYDGKEFTELSQPKNWKEQKKENKAEKKEKGYNYLAYEYEIKEGGYLVLEMHDYGSYVNNNSMIRFDEDKKEVWRYKYNTSGDKKIKEILRVIEKDDKYIYCTLEKQVKANSDFDFVVIDMVTGQEVKHEPINIFNQQTLQNINSLGRIDNDRTFDDKIVLVGYYFGVNENFNTGFARMIVDKKTLSVKGESVRYELDMQPFMAKINRYGYVENGYKLLPKDMFFLNDGSVGILMEKYKESGQYSASKSTDLICVYTDKDFKVKGVKVYEKEKTKWFHSDYLFSQYLNDGKDVVFFYKDRQKDENTKEKNWNLFINTLIDGKYNQEIVPISSKQNIIWPYIAKQGYILLQEFNEKEKYNQVRLERLNF